MNSILGGSSRILDRDVIWRKPPAGPELCDMHRCPKCKGDWADWVGTLIGHWIICPLLVMWLTNYLRPEIQWLPHLSFLQALALLMLVGQFKTYTIRVMPR